MADSRFFVDIMSDVVDSMRETGVVSSSSEVSGVYTLITNNSFSALDSISILDVNYLITAATLTTITISAATGLDFAGETWKDLAPYYDYGHYMELAARLSRKNTDQVKKFRKFPLILLVTDLKKSYKSHDFDYMISPPVILIINKTDKNYTSQERTDNNFKPILLPLYESFIEKMIDSKLISTPNDIFLNDRIDHYGWGNETVYGNTGLIFNRYLDAIEINPTELNIYKKRNDCTALSY